VVTGHQRFGGPCCLHLQGSISHCLIMFASLKRILDYGQNLENHLVSVVIYHSKSLVCSIMEIPASNPSHDSGCTGCIFCGFPQMTGRYLK